MGEFCANCGASIPAGAKFCPRCGAAFAAQGVPEPTTPASPMSTTPPERSRAVLLIGVPITLIILGIAVWALLTGMPFSSDSKKLSRTEQPAPAVINEQSGATATTSQIRNPGDQPEDEVSGAGRGTEVISTTTTAMPAGMSTPPRQAAPRPAAPVVAAPSPVVTASPAPKADSSAPAPTPPPVSRATTSEITESQAEDVLRGYITSRDYYGVGADCVGVASQGYKNRGYTIDVVDRCGDRGRLGRWRVDTLTREVFVEKRDGRYLRP